MLFATSLKGHFTVAATAVVVVVVVGGEGERSAEVVSHCEVALLPLLLHGVAAAL